MVSDTQEDQKSWGDFIWKHPPDYETRDGGTQIRRRNANLRNTYKTVRASLMQETKTRRPASKPHQPLREAEIVETGEESYEVLFVFRRWIRINRHT